MTRSVPLDRYNKDSVLLIVPAVGKIMLQIINLFALLWEMPRALLKSTGRLGRMDFNSVINRAYDNSIVH